MSIKVMSLVWDTDFSSTEKLVLLKLADCGNDQGESIFPSVALVSRQTGLCERTVRYTLKQLSGKKLIKILHPSDGKKYKTNSYAVDLKQLKLNRGATDAALQEMQGRGAAVAGGGCSPCTQIIIEPPLKHNRIEKKPIVDKMAAMYNEILGEWLPNCREVSDARKKRLFIIYNDHCNEDYDLWKDYLVYISGCGWLLGENGRGWRANFDWIIKKQNMNKILEGTYETRVGKSERSSALDGMFDGFQQAVSKC